MKLKTSITILGGCLLIFLFIMLPIVFSIQEKKDNIVSSYSGSSFVLKDVNNKPITESSFEGPLTAIFFGFTNCPDICPMTLSNLDQVLEKLNNNDKEKYEVLNIVPTQVDHHSGDNNIQMKDDNSIIREDDDDSTNSIKDMVNSDDIYNKNSAANDGEMINDSTIYTYLTQTTIQKSCTHFIIPTSTYNTD